jgi:WhiB family redox-sensing transcriptional regulator
VKGEAAYRQLDRMAHFRHFSWEPWMAQGDCVGMDLKIWYPVERDDIGPAIRICEGCPVQYECGEYALTNRIRDGVWGGLSEARRRRILREAS